MIQIFPVSHPILPVLVSGANPQLPLFLFEGSGNEEDIPKLAVLQGWCAPMLWLTRRGAGPQAAAGPRQRGQMVNVEPCLPSLREHTQVHTSLSSPTPTRLNPQHSQGVGAAQIS